MAVFVAVFHMLLLWVVIMVVIVIVERVKCVIGS